MRWHRAHDVSESVIYYRLLFTRASHLVIRRPDTVNSSFGLPRGIVPSIAQPVKVGVEHWIPATSASGSRAAFAECPIGRAGFSGAKGKSRNSRAGHVTSRAFCFPISSGVAAGMEMTA